MGLYCDYTGIMDRQEHGNYYSLMGLYQGYIRVILGL